MKKSLFHIIGLFVVAVLFSNCASLTGFQDGRTVGKDRADLTGSINVSSSPNFEDWDEDDNGIPDLLITTFEIGGRYGIAENVDINLKISSATNLSIGTKIQVFGDRESQTALGVGLEVGVIGLASLGVSIWNVQIPLFFSFHPNEKFTWYLSPRYIYQFSAFAGANFGLNYLGGNTGIFMGRRHKFGIDLGYYNLGSKLDGNLGLLQIGIGGRFSLNRD